MHTFYSAVMKVILSVNVWRQNTHASTHHFSINKFKIWNFEVNAAAAIIWLVHQPRSIPTVPTGPQSALRGPPKPFEFPTILGGSTPTERPWSKLHRFDLGPLFSSDLPSAIKCEHMTQEVPKIFPYNQVNNG